MESSLEPSEGTSQSHISKILQDPAVPLVQRGKLDSLPKKHRHPKKGIKAKRMKKRKKKEKMKAQCPPSLPIPLAPSQSEEDATVDKIPAIVSAQDDPAFHHEDRVQRQQDKSPCVMDLECQIQPCDLSVQEPGPSSPTVTSLASPPLCFGRFLSCVRQTFSKSKKRKLCRRKSSNQAEAGGDAKVPRPDRLSSLGPNKV